MQYSGLQKLQQKKKNVDHWLKKVFTLKGSYHTESALYDNMCLQTLFLTPSIIVADRIFL